MKPCRLSLRHVYQRHRFPLAACLAAALLLAAGPAGAAGPAAPGVREVTEYSITDFLATTTYRGGHFSADNSKVLVYSDKDGVFNAYAIPVAGGEPEQLTRSTTNAVIARGYFPGDDRFLYSSDEAGNEDHHIYVREVDGTVLDLTPGESFTAAFLGWAADETAFFVRTNERDARHFDIYEYKIAAADRTDKKAEDYPRKLLYQDEAGYFFADISRDRRYIAFFKDHSNADSDVYVYDREAGSMKLITEHEGDVSHGAKGFGPDGKKFYLTCDADSEFRYLLSVHLEDGTREVIEQPAWDVTYSYFSWQGNYHVVGINQDARTALKVYQVGEDGSRTRVSLPALPNADITDVRFSRDESKISFYATSGRNPADLFVADLAGGKPVQLTRSLSGNIGPEDLVEGQVVRFKSFDGVEIPGVLYKPHRASPESPVPALVAVHGGPGGQARIGYRPLYQYLVNHGYAIYAINNRGSWGYGKTFFHLDDQKHGQDDLDDCVSSKQMLIDTGWVDPQKIGILGASYGGYMTLAALAFRPDEFSVGVDMFGASNWVRTIANIPPRLEAVRKVLAAELGDLDDEEHFKSISPLFHAHNIKQPLIVLQGANDPRVLQVESDEIVEAAKANGVPVEYIVFPDEGHSFLKKENREHGYKAILDFLDKYLKAPTEAPVVFHDALRAYRGLGGSRRGSATKGLSVSTSRGAKSRTLRDGARDLGFVVPPHPRLPSVALRTSPRAARVAR